MRVRRRLEIPTILFIIIYIHNFIVHNAYSLNKYFLAVVDKFWHERTDLTEADFCQVNKCVRSTGVAGNNKKNILSVVTLETCGQTK